MYICNNQPARHAAVHGEGEDSRAARVRLDPADRQPDMHATAPQLGSSHLHLDGEAASNPGASNAYTDQGLQRECEVRAGHCAEQECKMKLKQESILREKTWYPK